MSPDDIDFVQAYDDYPVICFLQIEDLGFCAKGEAPDFVRGHDLAVGGDFPFNTSGGQLSVGQAGAAGGSLGLVEAIRQLTDQSLGATVAGAEHGLVSCFGMINYDRGLCSFRGHIEPGAGMTTPLPPPQRKDPVKRTRQPTLPPGNRSREAHGLTAMAAVGRFALQTCGACGTVQYPPRQICGKCLSDDLPWMDVASGGSLLAETTLHHSNDLFFRDRLPWRLGMVAMDAGPSVVAHVAEDCRRGERVRLSLGLDKSGMAVMQARPESPGPYEEDDRQLREMSFDPKDRRVLIVDGKTGLGLALAKAFGAAGAREINVGHAEPWKASASLAAVKDLPGVSLFPLDVTDTDSVQELASLIGGKVEILVNNSYYLRPGGAVDRFDLNTSRDEMDVHYHGLLRLAGSFGPAMRGRGRGWRARRCGMGQRLLGLCLDQQSGVRHLFGVAGRGSFARSMYAGGDDARRGARCQCLRRTDRRRMAPIGAAAEVGTGHGRAKDYRRAEKGTRRRSGRRDRGRNRRAIGGKPQGTGTPDPAVATKTDREEGAGAWPTAKPLIRRAAFCPVSWVASWEAASKSWI